MLTPIPVQRPPSVANVAAVRVAIIGTGHIGGTLGRALQRRGHEVTFGSGSHAGEDLDGIAAVDVPTALGGADVVLLAIPGAAVAELAATQADALQGCLVIDATNNLAGASPNARDELADIPGLRYARAFNTLGWENFERPQFGQERADLFYSCDDAGDVATVGTLIEDVGLHPVHVGLGAHAVVDGLLPLWFALSKVYGRHLAFRLLTDGGA